MGIRIHSLRAALLAGSVLAASPLLAAEVTPERLLNPEPQNWLMNHRTYDGQRFSPLDKINKANVKGLKLAYAVALGGGAGTVPMFDPTYRPGDNLYTNSAISWDPDTGKMNWYFQFTPGDMWDFDEVGTHI